jgi:hypothetical protein
MTAGPGLRPRSEPVSDHDSQIGWRVHRRDHFDGGCHISSAAASQSGALCQRARQFVHFGVGGVNGEEVTPDSQRSQASVNF